MDVIKNKSRTGLPFISLSRQHVRYPLSVYTNKKYGCRGKILLEGGHYMTPLQKKGTSACRNFMKNYSNKN